MKNLKIRNLVSMCLALLIIFTLIPVTALAEVGIIRKEERESNNEFYLADAIESGYTVSGNYAQYLCILH